MGAIAVAALVQILYQLDQYYKSLLAADSSSSSSNVVCLLFVVCL